MRWDDPDLRWAYALLDNLPVPYVPTRRESLSLVFEALQLREGDVFADLGCGDGRVVAEAARRYPLSRALCVEARFDLVEKARETVEEAGVGDRVLVVRGDFFSVPLRGVTAVYMYLLTSINEALKPKLSRELPEGARVATLDFPVPGWRPVKTLGDPGWQRRVYLYVIGVSDR
ncbi:MAG: methyltransferase domain-containing protein [Desulfurococcales archaeon]|nr:methyltransferase domain-containing protein [Desulfurococcales archaeon]